MAKTIMPATTKRTPPKKNGGNDSVEIKNLPVGNDDPIQKVATNSSVMNPRFLRLTTSAPSLLCVVFISSHY